MRFHAVGPEMVAMLAGWAVEFGLSAALGRLFDEQPIPVRDNDFAAALTRTPAPDFVILGRHPLRLGPGLSLPLLVQANPGCLILQLGQQVDDGLRESLVGAVSDDPADLVLWRRLIARARRSMRSGAEVINPVTGASVTNRSHRYTDEAFALQSAGVAMLAVAGWVIYRLGPGQDAT